MWWLRELGGDLCERVMLQWLHTYYQIQTQTDTCRLMPIAEISVTLFLGVAVLYCSERNTHLHMTRNMLLLLKTKQKSCQQSASSPPLFLLHISNHTQKCKSIDGHPTWAFSPSTDLTARLTQLLATNASCAAQHMQVQRSQESVPHL